MGYSYFFVNAIKSIITPNNTTTNVIAVNIKDNKFLFKESPPWPLTSQNIFYHIVDSVPSLKELLD
ncbi:hypothetical protein PVOR_02000 [Paenibacillus vortex V453]|uniref:Uncharacterized protein n=1 Tax=Paenibacillus vortex V453 TaxID=715225 RepID=A0A2R9T2I3_9BACL|nr:hypothetical protein PVOR_02000 [Paenibacillus vortex V453]